MRVLFVEPLPVQPAAPPLPLPLLNNTTGATQGMLIAMWVKNKGPRRGFCDFFRGTMRFVLVEIFVFLKIFVWLIVWKNIFNCLGLDCVELGVYVCCISIVITWSVFVYVMFYRWLLFARKLSSFRNATCNVTVAKYCEIIPTSANPLRYDNNPFAPNFTSALPRSLGKSFSMRSRFNFSPQNI